MGPVPEKEKVEALQERWLEKKEPSGGRSNLQDYTVVALSLLSDTWCALRQTKTLGRLLRQHGVSSEWRGLVKGKTLKNG